MLNLGRHVMDSVEGLEDAGAFISDVLGDLVAVSQTGRGKIKRGTT